MNIAKAVSLKIAGTVMFALMNAQGRYLGELYPLGEVVFFRSLFAAIPIIIFFGLRNELKGALHTNRPWDHVVRGTFGVVGVFCTFGALARIPIADFTAIAFLAPLVTVIFAAVFLREKVHIYRWSAVIIGFCGIILMLIPYFQDHAAMTASTLIGVGFAFANTFTAGGATIQIRRLTATEKTSSIVIIMTSLVLLASLLTLPFGWRMPASWFDVMMFVGIGISGGLGQIFFTDSLRHAPASFLAPFDYTALLWAFMIGYWVFGEVPTLYVVAGAAIVAGAGIFVILRERALGLKRLREVPIAPDASVSDEDKNPDAPVSARTA